ncbi:hypothetical protein SK128_000102, partial [Halocaridina rubra]
MLLIHLVPALARRNRRLAHAIVEHTVFIGVMSYYFELLRHQRALLQKEEEAARRRRRRYWIRPYLRRRARLGHYENVMKELSLESPDLYRNFIRLDEPLFNEIVEKVRPYIEVEGAVGGWPA